MVAPYGASRASGVASPAREPPARSKAHVPAIRFRDPTAAGCLHAPPSRTNPSCAAKKVASTQRATLTTDDDDHFVRRPKKRRHSDGGDASISRLHDKHEVPSSSATEPAPCLVVEERLVAAKLNGLAGSPLVSTGRLVCLSSQ